MTTKIEQFIKDENGGATVSLKMIVYTIFITMLMLVIIDFYAMTSVYSYIKNQQGLANRAVYAALDETYLARRELYIDESLGRSVFESYLNKNLDPAKTKTNISGLRLVDGVKVVHFEIYNTNELPAISPSGKAVTELSVYSEIEINIRPILIGKFTTVKFNPRMMTDIPDHLLRTYHP